MAKGNRQAAGRTVLSVILVGVFLGAFALKRFQQIGLLVVLMVASAPVAGPVAAQGTAGKAEQYIKEGKNAIKWTRLSCHGFRNNEVRLQLHVLAYNMANFLRTLALPDEIEHWSMPTMREKLVSAPRWFGTVGTSPFSLPRSRFHGGCSRRSCGSSNVELIIRKDTADGGRRVDFGLLA